MIGVDVTTVWIDPAKVRPVDAPILAAEPDGAAWAAGMDVAARLDLHGRVVTQAPLGEPAIVTGTRDGWAHVVLPRQPSSSDSRGYPGWVPAAHLAEGTADPVTANGAGLLDTARTFLGLAYLWSGFSEHGVDCSGLVALCHRRCGIVIPRDAHDQAVAGAPVPLDALEPGDLVFFGRDHGRGAVHHVGMAVGDGTMLHAPKTGAQVEFRALSDPEYAGELCAARRFTEAADAPARRG